MKRSLQCALFQQKYNFLGDRGGYIKHPCFICLWDRKGEAAYRSKEDWSSGKAECDKFTTSVKKRYNITSFGH